MDNQNGQQPQQPNSQQNPTQNNGYGQVPPQGYQYVQQPQQPYQQQPYMGGYQQPPQQPYYTAPVAQAPSVLTGGWKAIFVLLGIFMLIFAILVAFLRSRNSPMCDAELRESMKYTIIGFVAMMIVAVVLVLLGVTALAGLAALM